MLGDFFFDLLNTFLHYLPLTAGAFISILLLRYPDLTIEASWNLGAICACIASAFVSSLLAPLAGILVGAACGVLTSLIFMATGRAKLLSALVSYYILEAVGFHMLGDRASEYLDHASTGFGFPENPMAGFWIYLICGLIILFVCILFLKSPSGIKIRLIGENPSAAHFFQFSLNAHFSKGLIVSNAIVGFGGGLWGCFYGHASNLQGIGLVIKAFLSLLIGDELLRAFKLTNRSVIGAALLGTAVFVVLTQGSEFLQAILSAKVDHPWYRPTDKQVVVSIFLMALIMFRRKGMIRGGTVSEW